MLPTRVTIFLSNCSNRLIAGHEYLCNLKYRKPLKLRSKPLQDGEECMDFLDHVINFPETELRPSKIVVVVSFCPPAVQDMGDHPSLVNFVSYSQK